jgi:hypothetical protein
VAAAVPARRAEPREIFKAGDNTLVLAACFAGTADYKWEKVHAVAIARLLDSLGPLFVCYSPRRRKPITMKAIYMCIGR